MHCQTNKNKNNMKIYNVINKETGYGEEFYNLSNAKKAMKEHNAKGYIYKVYSNGDMVACGEITLKGYNKKFIANSNQKNRNY